MTLNPASCASRIIATRRSSYRAAAAILLLDAAEQQVELLCPLHRPRIMNSPNGKRWPPERRKPSSGVGIAMTKASSAPSRGHAFDETAGR